MSSARCHKIEGVIHTAGFVVSTVHLNALVLNERRDEYGSSLSEAEETEALETSRYTDLLGRDVLVLKDLPTEGSPTAFVSLTAHPELRDPSEALQRKWATERISRLRAAMGSLEERRDAFEDLMESELLRWLPGWKAGRYSETYHEETRDLALTSPEGKRVNIELRNRSTEVQHNLQARKGARNDRKRLREDRANGRTSLHVSADFTRKYRRQMREENPDSGVIATGMYLVTTPEQLEAHAAEAMPWPAMLASEGVPLIAEMIARKLLGDDFTGERVEVPQRPKRIKPSKRDRIEVRRLIRGSRGARTPEELAAEARRVFAEKLAEGENPTQGGIAILLGVSAGGLSEALKAHGGPLRSHGGGGRGAGRKESSSQFRDPVLVGEETPAIAE